MKRVTTLVLCLAVLAGELRRLLRAKQPGDTVRVEILRGTRRQTLNVRLGEA